jgi:hypothetical protein
MIDQYLQQEIKTDYELYMNHPLEYQRKVNSISNLLSLNGENSLMAECWPVYVVGRPESPFVLFGLNPRYGESIGREEVDARKGWNEYREYLLNFYKRRYCPRSPFYNQLGKLFCGMTDMKDQWDCFDCNLAVLELIPYHSRRTGLPSRLSNIQFDYLNKRFHSSLEYIRKFKPRLLIFNGKIWNTLLVQNKFLNEVQTKNIVKGFDMHLFTIENIPCVLFDKFLGSGHFLGLSKSTNFLSYLISSFNLYFPVLDYELYGLRLTQSFHDWFWNVSLTTPVFMICNTNCKLSLVFLPPRHYVYQLIVYL